VSSSKRRMQATTTEIKQIKMRIWAMASIQLRDAIDDGYWIEAVAIEESMMADSIESYLQKYYKVDKFLTLGEAISTVLKLNLTENDEALFIRARRWVADRDVVIHELIKVNKKNQLTWEQKVNNNFAVALEGQELAKELKKWSSRKQKFKS
jgi:hypothetical protein